MIFDEDIRNLCTEYTDLLPGDVDVLMAAVKELPGIVERENVDCFIDCLCRNPREAVNAAVCLRDDTDYMFSTMGYIIRDSDEPAVFRSLIHGLDTKDVLAVCYVTTENNRMVQSTSPIKNGTKTVGVLIREHGYSHKDEDEPESARGENGVPRKDADIESIEWLGESVDDAVIILDSDKRVVYRNSAAAKVYRDFGYLHDILGGDYISYSIHGDLLVGQGREEASIEVNAKEYYLVKQFYFAQRRYPYLITLRDITALRQSNEKLVVESEALRETHHRIKNNLQTIYSLLDLQRRRVKTGELASMLQDTMNRIISISVSYEPLLAHRGDMLSVKKVLTRLAENFRKQMADFTHRIDIEVSGDDVCVSLDTCTSVAMAVNELIQNSMKHAFSGFKKNDVGKIDILISDSPLYTSISVKDNGSGFARKEGEGLGLQIVRNIVAAKLSGHIETHSGNEGTIITFDFRHEAKPEIPSPRELSTAKEAL